MSPAEVHRWCPGVVTSAGKQQGRKGTGWDIFFSGELTSADISPSPLHTLFGSGSLVYRICPLTMTPQSPGVVLQNLSAGGTGQFCFSYLDVN